MIGPRSQDEPPQRSKRRRAWASAGGGGKTGICPTLEIGTKNQDFVENLKLAAKFRLIHLLVAITVYLPV